MNKNELLKEYGYFKGHDHDTYVNAHDNIKVEYKLADDHVHVTTTNGEYDIPLAAPIDTGIAYNVSLSICEDVLMMVVVSGQKTRVTFFRLMGTGATFIRNEEIVGHYGYCKLANGYMILIDTDKSRLKYITFDDINDASTCAYHYFKLFDGDKSLLDADVVKVDNLLYVLLTESALEDEGGDYTASKVWLDIIDLNKEIVTSEELHDYKGSIYISPYIKLDYSDTTTDVLSATVQDNSIASGDYGNDPIENLQHTTIYKTRCR